MQALRLLIVAVVLLGGATAQPLASEGDKGEKDEETIEGFIKEFTEPLRIRESKPVTVKDAQFVLVAQTNWRPGKADTLGPRVAHLEIQLRLTNLKKNEVLFPTCNTFGLRIIKANGKEVRPRGVRKATISTR